MAMQSQSQTYSRLDEDFGWTERQREVLGLLAKGYTNGQIGERLGISLDGAKWHVSEIISKLGVDTREEAAEYWRRYNGAPARLRRIWTSALAGPVLLRMGAGLGLLAVAGVVVFLAAALTGGGGTNSKSAPPTVGAGRARSVTASAAAKNGQTQQLRMAAPTTVSSHLVVYYGVGRYQTEDEGNSNLTRVYRPAFTGETEALQKDDLFAKVEELNADAHGAGWAVESWAASDDMHEILVTFCKQQSMDGCLDPEMPVYRSVDAGQSWVVDSSLPSRSQFVGLTDDGAAVVTDKPTESGGGFQFWLFPSGTRLTPPVSDRTISLTRIQGLGVVWEDQGDVYDLAGKQVYRPHLSDVVGAYGNDEHVIARQPDGAMWVTWTEPTGTDDQLHSTTYLASVDTSGKTTKVVSWDGVEWLGPAVWLGESRFMSTILLPGPKPIFEAAIIDAQADTVQPLPELSKGLMGTQGPIIKRAIVATD